MTVSEQIYQELYDRILYLQLKPGQDLNMKNMLNEPGMSRSPLRDALLKLQEDNLVEIFPQRGTCVTKIKLQQVEIERFMRSTLELAVVPKFIQTCNKDHLLKMRSAIESQKIAIEGTNYKDFLLYDDVFHEVIFSGSGMERIWKITKSQSGNYRRFRVLSSYVNSILMEIIEEHEQILKAFSDKDEEKILTLEKSHLSKLGTEVDILQHEYSTYFE